MWPAVPGALLASHSGGRQQGNEGEGKGHALHQWTASRNAQGRSLLCKRVDMHMCTSQLCNVSMCMCISSVVKELWCIYNIIVEPSIQTPLK